MWDHTHCCCCCIYIWAHVTCYAFRNSPWPRCNVLELGFSKAGIRSFSKANGRLSTTWNTSLLNLLLVYRVASHSSVYILPKKELIQVE